MPLNGHLQFTFLLFLLLCNVHLQARVISVGQHDGHITSIKEAVSMAVDGDSIWVHSGVYREGNIIINKSIYLKGLDHPCLDGEGKYEILTISGRDITVSGFVFLNSGYSSMLDYAAIKCIDARNITLEENEITHAYFAIHISNVEDIVIRNNRIHGNPKTEQNTGNGIHLWKCKKALIDGNIISKHRDGIYFEFVTESLITCNLSYENIRYGLHFMFSHKDTYTYNRFVENGAGVAVMYSKEVDMQANEFVDNWGSAAYGILLKDISDSYIAYNLFDQNTVGIYMEGTNRINIHWNHFHKNGWAMKVQASCNENKIQHNNFSGNSFDIATNGSLVLNSFDQNYWDKYDGYDRTRDGYGDIPYRPVSMYSMIVEQNPYTLILLRSILISFLDKAEKAIPSLTPELLIDNKPLIKPLCL
ncbi:MAG: nitrous oxide reductase family maturation protein NosD [Saprospiraceae bacterium]|nr:nitrous oxide reductase family maturation protein NosD [Saprospiraceae bacterium]